VTGWLAAPEPMDGAAQAAVTDAAQDPAHRIASVDIATLVNTWPYTDLDQAYVNELGPDAGLAPVPAPAPPNGKTSWNILNLGYWLQWWLFGVVALWWFSGYVRRVAHPVDPTELDDLDESDEFGEVQEEEDEGEPGDEDGAPATPRSPAPASRPAE
jgi:hypothetical protein